jgi:GNAT superfamily N-acetyltransferase
MPLPQRPGRETPAPIPSIEFVADVGGCEAAFRPLVAADRPTLSRSFRALSPESRFHRFNSSHTELSDTELASLFDLDYRDRFAWAVEVTCDGLTTPAAVGRYLSYGDGDRADVAVTVRDDWQGRGLGNYLMDTLIITARHHGFRTFDTIVSADNDRMLNIFRNRGAQLSAPSSSEVDVRLDLAAAADRIVDHPLLPFLAPSARQVDVAGRDKARDGGR